MLDKILSLDTELLIFLNGLGSESLISLAITRKQPFFFSLFFFLYKNKGLSKLVLS
jgi:undecaprenyl-diphosphatase